MADNQTNFDMHGSAGRGFSSPSAVVMLMLLIVGVVVAAGILMTDKVIASDDASSVSTPDTQTTPASVFPDHAGEAPLGTYTATSSSEDQNRATNIKLASEAINGTVIQPGEVFSFNDTVGDTSNDPRYCYANAIDGTNVIEERGGGICQVSSAVYSAAVSAGLEIKERHAHSVAQSYASLGMDATVSYGTLDLRILNNTDAALTLCVASEGETVTASFYGKQQADGISITITSQVDETVMVENDDNTTTTSYVVSSYKVTSENGAVKQKELLSTDVYTVTSSSTVIISSVSKNDMK